MDADPSIRWSRSCEVASQAKSVAPDYGRCTASRHAHTNRTLMATNWGAFTLFRDPERLGGLTVEIAGRLNALLVEKADPNRVKGVWGKMVAGQQPRPDPPVELIGIEPHTAGGTAKAAYEASVLARALKSARANVDVAL